MTDLIEPKNDLLCGLLDADGADKDSAAFGERGSCNAVLSAGSKSGSSSITSCLSGLASRKEPLLDRLLDGLAKCGRGGARGSDEAESGGVDGKLRARCSWNGIPNELLEDPITPWSMSSCISYKSRLSLDGAGEYFATYPSAARRVLKTFQTVSGCAFDSRNSLQYGSPAKGSFDIP